MTTLHLTTDNIVHILTTLDDTFQCNLVRLTIQRELAYYEPQLLEKLDVKAIPVISIKRPDMDWGLANGEWLTPEEVGEAPPGTCWLDVAGSPDVAFGILWHREGRSFFHLTSVHYK